MRYLRLILLGVLVLAAIVVAGALLAPWPGARAGVDTDGDGYDDATEAYLDTDPLDDCPDSPGDDAWPPDNDQNTMVNLLDLLNYKLKMGLLYRDPQWNSAVQRLDLSEDGAISLVADVWYHLGPDGAFNDTCVGGPDPPPVLPQDDPVTMGIDPEITANSASTLGALESCLRVDVAPANLGDSVADHTIDVYVTGDTDEPTAYDAWVTYDPDQVDPVSWDDLIKLPGAVSFTQKMMSRLNAAAMYTFGSGTSGDGTIVRIDLDAISAGPACFAFGYAKAYSSAGRTHPTSPQATMVAINEDCPTVDSDGDGVFDVCDSCLDDVNPGQEDFDGDGVGDACDNCWDSTNAGQEDTDGDTIGNVCDNCPADYNASQDDTDGDGWGDACDNCPSVATVWLVPPGDGDCDGFSTDDENACGTDPGVACPSTPDPDDEDPDAWPPDWDDSQTVNLLDLLPYKPHYGATDPLDPLYDARYDLYMDGAVNLLDLLPFKPFFNLSCA